MSILIKKTFLDIDKEEAWLNQRGESGLMLVGYHNGKYEFEDVSPLKYQYKIDQPNFSRNKKREYLEFLRECDVSVVSEYGGRIYLRKNMAAGPFELYSEKKDRKTQGKNRYFHFFYTGMTQLLMGTYLLVYTWKEVETTGPAFWFTVLVEVGLMISGLIFFGFGVMKHRKHSKMEELDIWE